MGWIILIGIALVVILDAWGSVKDGRKPSAATLWQLSLIEQARAARSGRVTDDEDDLPPPPY